MLVVLDSVGVQSQYRQAEAVYLNAEKQYKKMKSLYESGAISESQLDGVETQYKVARADFDASRQSIQITAPFDGVITDIYVRVGDEVAPGTPVVEIANVRLLRLFLEVPGSQVEDIHIGQTVVVQAPSDTSVAMTGKVSSVSDAANRSTRSFEVECEFQAPPAAFAPGMYVIAKINTKSLTGALIVPNDAIIYRTGQALVYLVDGDTASLVPVTVAAAGDGKSAVDGKLAVGQKVVVVGQKNLTPGTPVREAAI
jgi:RND family efflux transporter MFP subunit